MSPLLARFGCRVMSALSPEVIRSRLARFDVADILPKGSGYLRDLLEVVERLTGGNANADHISDAFASREVRAGRFQFRAMNFRIEV